MQKQFKLLNGCNIFVTTVPCLAGIMKKYPYIFDKERIEHFVIEDIDLILSRHKDLCIEIIKTFCNFSKEMNTQIVVTSRTWHEILRQFITNIPNILLLIGNYVEASRYAKSKISLDICGGDEKFKELRRKHGFVCVDHCIYHFLFLF